MKEPFYTKKGPLYQKIEWLCSHLFIRLITDHGKLSGGRFFLNIIGAVEAEVALTSDHNDVCDSSSVLSWNY